MPCNGHVYVMMSLMTLRVLTDDANEGDLHFSIPRVNARPGKGNGMHFLYQSASISG